MKLFGMFGILLGLIIIFQQIYYLIKEIHEWYFSIIISIIGIIIIKIGYDNFNYKIKDSQSNEEKEN